LEASNGQIGAPGVGECRHEQGKTMNSIVYLVGLIVIVLAVLSLVGLA
jgi:hypothetical protein